MVRNQEGETDFNKNKRIKIIILIVYKEKFFLNLIATLRQTHLPNFVQIE